LAQLLKRGLKLGDCVRSKKGGTITPDCAKAVMANDPHYLATAMKFIKIETKKEYYTNRNVWNGLAFEREVEFWEVAFFKAAKQYFPHVRGSNVSSIRSFANSPTASCPDRREHDCAVALYEVDLRLLRP
jgi:hypothetical protein